MTLLRFIVPVVVLVCKYTSPSAAWSVSRVVQYASRRHGRSSGRHVPVSFHGYRHGCRRGAAPPTLLSQTHQTSDWIRQGDRKTPSCGNLAELLIGKRRRYLVLVLACTVLFAAFPRNALAVLNVGSASAPNVSAAAAATSAAASSVVSSSTVGALGSTRAISTAMELRLSLRLLFASIVGAAVGWERSATNHSAGVRTMALVSLGAAAFTICSMYGFLASGQRFDPSRMASNVASGVGFIGAGVITTHKMRANSSSAGQNAVKNLVDSVVHGLTTAAAIWMSAAVGVASGVGLYFIAGTTALVTIAILRFGRVKHTPLGKRIGYTSRKTKIFYKDTHALSTWDEHHNLVQQPPPSVSLESSQQREKQNVVKPRERHEVDRRIRDSTTVTEDTAKKELLTNIEKQMKEKSSLDKKLDLHKNGDKKDNIHNVSP